MKNQFFCILVFFFLFFLFVNNSFARKCDFILKTEAYKGLRFPKNAIAIWVENGEEEFINTVGVWGLDVNFMLRNWRIASGLMEDGWFDAVTGATREDHKDTLRVSWNLTDTNGDTVPDGDYRFWAELLEDDYFWQQMNPNEEYLGKKTNGTITIKGTEPVTENGTLDDNFTVFTAQYKPQSEIQLNPFSYKRSMEIKISYVPVTQLLEIKLQRPIKKRISISIIDLQGRQLKKVIMSPHNGKVFISTRQFSSGLYFIESKVESQTTSTTVFFQIK